jgi:hypothetical protein
MNPNTPGEKEPHPPLGVTEGRDQVRPSATRGRRIPPAVAFIALLAVVVVLAAIALVVL